MPERNKHSEIPDNVLKEASFETPEKTMLIKLPYISETVFWENNRQYMSMHTDMMGAFCNTVNSLKKDVRENLYIQTRVMSHDQWEELKDHPAFYFFYQRREHRRLIDRRRKTIAYLVPKRIRLSQQQLADFVKLEFNPRSLASDIGFKVGWFRAEWLARKAEQETSFNSLAPFLGAVNQFRIGSDTLKAGMLMKVAVRFTLGFEEYASSVRNSLLDNLSDQAIEASADILKYTFK